MLIGEYTEVMDYRESTIRKMREERYTLAEIGKQFGISRQRVYQILNREKCKQRERINSAKKDIIQKKIRNMGVEEMQEYLLEIVKKNQQQNPIGEYLKNITKNTGIGGGSRDRIRELVRLRDNHTCQMCGKKWRRGQRRFDVHHIIGDFQDSRKADRSFENQITLCHKCHLRIDGWKMRKSARREIRSG